MRRLGELGDGLARPAGYLTRARGDDARARGRRARAATGCTQIAMNNVGALAADRWSGPERSRRGAHPGVEPLLVGLHPRQLRIPGARRSGWSDYLAELQAD